MNPRVSRSSAAGVEGHRVPDRQDGGQAGRRVHARRDPQRHHPQDAGQLRAGHRLRRHQGAPLGVREVPRPGRGPRHLDAVGRGGHGHRPHVPRVDAEGACDRSSRAASGSTATRARRQLDDLVRRRAAGRGLHRHARPAVPARGLPSPGDVGLEQVAEATKVDPWFLDQFSRIVEERAHLAEVGVRRRSARAELRRAKRLGFATPSSATCGACPRPSVRARRLELDLRPDVQDGRHLRGRVRGRHAVPLLDLGGRRRGRRHRPAPA